MSSILLNLYRKRLQSLSNTVESLHQTVSNDQALKIMDAPQLMRYRIDRVNQLVKEIMNSQKQQIIIYLLNICQTSTKNEPLLSSSNKENNGSKKQLHNQVKQLSQEIEMLKKQLVQERQRTNQYKFQIEQRQQQKLKAEQQAQQIQTKIASKQAQLIESYAHLKEKDIRIGKITEKIRQYEDVVSNLRFQLQNRSHQVRQIKSKLQETEQKIKQKFQPMKLKIQRIQSIKKQMGCLFTQMQTNKDMIYTLKQIVGKVVKEDIHQLRKECSQLKNQLVNVFFNGFRQDFQLLTRQCSKKNIKIEQNIVKEQEKLLGKMNQIQAQMDCFIETKIKNR